MKKGVSENYLEKIPVISEKIFDVQESDNLVTLVIENKGAWNRIFQKLLKKPKFSYIHLDENGSFIWKTIDGDTNLVEIGKRVDEHFGESAHPLYERLAEFFHILESNNFVKFK